jgi:hypothetical protein
MDHMAAERVQELAARSTNAGGGTPSHLLPEECAHLQECPQCIDAVAEAVRENIRGAGKPAAEI